MTVTYRGRPGDRVVAIGESSVRKKELRLPVFGMWKDCAELADVQAHLRRLRGRSADFPELAPDPCRPTETD